MMLKVSSPSSQPAGPVAKQAPNDDEWWKLPVGEPCIHCNLTDWQQEGFGPRTLMVCSCCHLYSTHMDCYEAATGSKMSKEEVESDHDWFCSKGCEKVHSHFQSLTNKRLELKGDPQFTLEVATLGESNRGTKTTLDTVMKIFKSAFDPLVMENGRDLIEMVCTSYETPVDEVSEEDEEQEAWDFSSFRVLVLRRGSTIMSVGTLRIFGTRFAELPFVATKEGYRREGNCRRLVQAVEDMLHAVGVKYLVLPSIRSLVPMWSGHFHFIPFTLAEAQALEDAIVSPDPDTAVLMKKSLAAPRKPSSSRASGSRAKAPVAPAAPAAAAAAAAKKQPSIAAASAADAATDPEAEVLADSNAAASGTSAGGSSSAAAAAGAAATGDTSAGDTPASAPKVMRPPKPPSSATAKAGGKDQRKRPSSTGSKAGGASEVPRAPRPPRPRAPRPPRPKKPASPPAPAAALELSLPARRQSTRAQRLRMMKFSRAARAKQQAFKDLMLGVLLADAVKECVEMQDTDQGKQIEQQSNQICRMQQEVARLQQENSRLQQQLAALTGGPPPGEAGHRAAAAGEALEVDAQHQLQPPGTYHAEPPPPAPSSATLSPSVVTSATAWSDPSDATADMNPSRAMADMDSSEAMAEMDVDTVCTSKPSASTATTLRSLQPPALSPAVPHLVHLQHGVQLAAMQPSSPPCKHPALPLAAPSCCQQHTPLQRSPSPISPCRDRRSLTAAAAAAAAAQPLSGQRPPSSRRFNLSDSDTSSDVTTASGASSPLSARAAGGAMSQQQQRLYSTVDSLVHHVVCSALGFEFGMEGEEAEDAEEGQASGCSKKVPGDLGAPATQGFIRGNRVQLHQQMPPVKAAAAGVTPGRGELAVVDRSSECCGLREGMLDVLSPEAGHLEQEGSTALAGEQDGGDGGGSRKRRRPHQEDLEGQASGGGSSAAFKRRSTVQSLSPLGRSQPLAVAAVLATRAGSSLSPEAATRSSGASMGASGKQLGRGAAAEDSAGALADITNKAGAAAGASQLLTPKSPAAGVKLISGAQDKGASFSPEALSTHLVNMFDTVANEMKLDGLVDDEDETQYRSASGKVREALSRVAAMYQWPDSD